MNPMVTCSYCGSELHGAKLGGLCHRCVSQALLKPGVERVEGAEDCVGDIARLLGRVEQGDSRHGGTAADLMPLVYEELRRLAAHKMAREKAGQTLQATALVHEAWLRLTGNAPECWNSRSHFFCAAAEAMRRILIEQARHKQSLKRGAGAERVDLDQMEMATRVEPDELLALNDALEKLVAEDPQSAELIKLRFFAGMTNREAAEALGISERSAKRFWTFARVWLFEEMRNPGVAAGDI